MSKVVNKEENSAGWELKTLDMLIEKGIIELGRGKIISKKDIAATPGCYPIYSSAKNNEGKFGEYGEYLYDEELITWSIDGGGRLFHREKHKFSVTNVGGILRIKDTNVINYRFLFYCLLLLHSKIKFDWVKKAHPSVIRKLYTEIPTPSLAVQKLAVSKIEEIFSHIDTGIEYLKKSKQLLKQYRQSVLKEAVTGELTKEWRERNGVSYGKTWRSLELGDVVDIIDPNPSHRYPPYDDGDVPLMATKQMVGEDDWDESTAKLTTSEFYEQRKASHGFKKDDIIFARKGRLGLTRRPPKLSRYAFSHTVFIVRGKDDFDINSDFMLWFLRREEAISWLLREMNVAAGVPTLGKAIFQKLPIKVPSKDEQIEISSMVEQKISTVDHTLSVIDKQFVKAEKNKQSILASVFQGDI